MEGCIHPSLLPSHVHCFLRLRPSEPASRRPADAGASCTRDADGRVVATSDSSVRSPGDPPPHGALRVRTAE